MLNAQLESLYYSLTSKLNNLQTCIQTQNGFNGDPVQPSLSIYVQSIHNIYVWMYVVHIPVHDMS